MGLFLYASIFGLFCVQLKAKKKYHYCYTWNAQAAIFKFLKLFFKY